MNKIIAGTTVLGAGLALGIIVIDSSGPDQGGMAARALPRDDPQGQRARGLSSRARTSTWTEAPHRFRLRDRAPTPMVAHEENEDPPEHARAGDGRFELTPDGDLVLSPKTRHGVERLAGLASREELERELEAIDQSLPASASERVRGLVAQYEDYVVALKQAMPPGQTPRDMNEVLAMLDQTHQLRAQHFGEQAAQSMFGEEERIARALIELQGVAQDSSLTDEQRSRQMAAIRDRVPELQVRELYNTGMTQRE